MSIKRTVGMYPTFDRSGAVVRSSHYCAGCGHGIVHKLITEALVDFGMQDRTIMVNPIGCAVFGYYYWDVGNVGAAHGRAPAVATALSRTLPHAYVLAYQGDGDLGAIGFNSAFQAASRGERMATFFINNATYGMTGGQMAPTSLIGQHTATTPRGRALKTEGPPLHVCEVFNQLAAPVYIERCSVGDTASIMKARKAIRKALEIQLKGQGYAFVEFLSQCPGITGGDVPASIKFLHEQLEKEFPLAVFRDRANEPIPPEEPAPVIPSLNEFFHTDTSTAAAPHTDPTVQERRLIFAGAGGQGVLSLGLNVAEAATFLGRYTTWFPTYGPEQRGGAASCALVLAGKPIGSPTVDRPDVLVAMSRPALERFMPLVKPGGVVFCETLAFEGVTPRTDIRIIKIPAAEIATTNGLPRAANTVILAAMLHCNATGLPAEAIDHARDATLRKKQPALIEKNRQVFEAALVWCRANLPK